MLISESNLNLWSKFTLPLQPLCESPSWSFHFMALRSPCQPALGVAPGASLKTKGSDKILFYLLQGKFSLLDTLTIYFIRTDIILSIIAFFFFTPWEQKLSCSKKLIFLTSVFLTPGLHWSSNFLHCFSATRWDFSKLKKWLDFCNSELFSSELELQASLLPVLLGLFVAKMLSQLCLFYFGWG